MSKEAGSMKCRMPAVLIVLMVAAGGTVGQERPEQARPPGTARLGGRVLAADTGRPISGAVVELHGWPDEPELLRAVTDKAGRFLFEELPPGRYGLVASKRGLFLDARYGQLGPDTPAHPLTVTYGLVGNVEIRMTRTGVITGRVVDEGGEPLVYAGISVLRESPAGIERVVMGFSNSTTNDRGEYRIFGLPPGTYVLYALARQESSDQRRYAPTYYPGVLDPSLAKRLTVTEGQELTKVDLTVARVTWVSIRGTASGPDGQLLGDGSVALHWATTGGIGGVVAPGSIRDGSFAIRDVVAGRYILRARHTPRPASVPGTEPIPDLSVAVPVTVGDKDLEGVHLKLTSGATLSGQLRFDGSAPAPRPGLFKVLVESGEPGRVLSVAPASDGTFVLRGIESGPRRVTCHAPAGWTVKTLTVDGRSSSDFVVEFRDETTAQILLTVSDRR
jgi:protocatechuate 3,4-dioxygenase beta subunit